MKQIYKVLFALALMGSYNSLFAQTDEIKTMFDGIFAPIDKSKIPYGILYESNYHTSRMYRYNGVFDTTIAGTEWEHIYNDIYRCAFNKTGLQVPETFIQNVYNEFGEIGNGDYGVVPIVLFFGQYSGIKDNAFTDNLLYTQNNTIHDVPGRTQSPYQLQTLFAAQPCNTVSGFGPVRFRLKSAFMFSNISPAPTAVSIDFGDGKGYNTYTIGGSDIRINYSDTNMKTIKVKYNYQGTTLIAKSYYKPAENRIPKPSSFYKAAPGPGPGTPSNSNYLIPVSQNDFWVTADIDYKGLSKLRGLVSISYAKKCPTCGHNNKLTKPVILVEGIDFGYKNNQGYNSYGKCGSIGYIDVSTGKLHDLIPPKGKESIRGFDDGSLNMGPEIINALNNAGYDLVYLDFENGSDLMQQNAMVVVKLIEEVNRLKDPAYQCSENMIIGASMGGQVVRYALTYMETHNRPHYCRTFVTFDSPNNGANVPLGLQFFINYFHTKSDAFFEDAKDAYSRIFTRPATKQLLKNYFLSDYIEESAERKQFLAELNSNGSYPSKYGNTRKVAIANGSGVGQTQGFNAGDQIIDFKFAISTASGATAGAIAGSFIPGVGTIVGGVIGGLIGHYIGDYEGRSYAAKDGGGMVFQGRSPGSGTGWTYNFAPASSKAYDSGPGGSNTGVSDLNNNAKNFPLILKFKAMDKSFGFIPIESSLGVKPPYNNNASYIPPKQSQQNNVYSEIPFDAYYSPTANQAHVTITQENIDFLMGQLKMNEYTLDPQLPSSKGAVYNYGKGSKILQTLSINSGGTLIINDFDNTEFGTGPKTIAGSAFDVYTSSCGTGVEVNNQGQFVLGEGGGDKRENNTAVVHIVAGTSLPIRSGGKLVINSGSSLIVESGGKLIIEDGADVTIYRGGKIVIEPGAEMDYKNKTANKGITFGTIPSNEPEPYVEFQGNLHIASNADFTFTGNGYVKFNMPTPVPFALTRNITAGTGARMTFKGADINDKVLEVTQEGMYPPDNIISFIVQKGTIALGPDARVVPTGVSTFINFTDAKVTSTSGTNNAHRGLTIFGQKYAIIDGCVFENGTYGIYAFLTYGGNPLRIARSTFQNCKYGLWTHDKGVNFTTCTFDNNTEEGWHAEAMAMPCKTYAGSMENTNGLSI